MGTKTSRHISLAFSALFFVMAIEAYGNISISPPNPTSQDIVTITVSGVWGDSCIPNASFIWVSGNNLYFDVIRDYPPGISCALIVCGWEQAQFVGPLSPGVYTVQTQLIGYPEFTETAQFTVGPTDRNVPGQYPTIQAAINASNNGDTIIVAPGTYYENINMKNGVTVKGAGADVTTIDGTQQGHVVSFNLSSASIMGFRITNSGSNPGYSAGIFVSQSTVTIKDNVIANNHYGITLSSNSNGTVTGNRVTGCTGAAAIKVESSNPTIINNLVAGNNWKGVYCSVSSPSIINNTISSNGTVGLSCSPTSSQIVINNIITDNETGIMVLGGATSDVALVHVAYNNVYSNDNNYWEEYGIIPGPIHSGPFTPVPGTGEISQDPLFANPNNYDYHLKSHGGRWNPNIQSWVTDVNTSPCIDAGDPNSDWTKELWPNGKRINMGAYGGTPQASMSLSTVSNIANLDNDSCDIVDISDLAVFVGKWCFEEYLLSEDLDRDGHVDFKDVAIFAEKYYESHLAEPNIIYNISPCTQELLQNISFEQMDQTRFTAAVEGRQILFTDTMVANCCADQLWLEMTINGNTITVYEHEHASVFCWCICNYPVDASLGPFKNGIYMLNVYEDYGGFIGRATFTIE